MDDSIVYNILEVLLKPFICNNKVDEIFIAVSFFKI